MPGFRRLAILDRGGAAIRLLAAVADVNAQSPEADRITTIALHGPGDEDAWFVRAANEPAALGARLTAATVDDVMTALAAVEADAVWVGWGPFAHSAELAERCQSVGITVVGAGWYDAAAVPPRGEQPSGARTRRVEVQVVSDGTTVTSLGLRDASTRRESEPVLIETGCTALDATAVRAVEDDAVRLARAAGFIGVGSVEYVVDAATSAATFAAFHPHLRPGHPVTEAVTALDLVAMGLRLALGRPLGDVVPSTVGAAIEVRLLAADPERGFAPAGGRLDYLRLPVGPGVRVDLGVTEGDLVDATINPLLATVVATGRDRDEARARLVRALSQFIVILDGGTTTKAVLARELDSPEVRSGDYDDGWLDRVIATGDVLPTASPLALAVAAIELYDDEERAVRDRFLASATRGRPSLPADIGHRIDLRMRGRAYRLHVYRTGPQDYRVVDGKAVVDVQERRLSRYERAVTCAGSAHRVVVDVQPGRVHVEVDGVPHVVGRDDGVLVRAEMPAFVVNVLVVAGETVTAHQPLLVLESMKMSTTVVAPVDGVIESLLAHVHTQVDTGAPLLRIRLIDSGGHGANSAPVDLGSLSGVAGGAASPSAVRNRLRSYLLGFDLDTDTARRLPDAMRAASASLPADDLQLVGDELDLLEIFTDTCALSRREPDPDAESDGRAASAQEHLFTFLGRLDVVGLPAEFVGRLDSALARYGTSSARPAGLRDALVPMYRSFVRARDVSWIATAILQRWLEHRALLAPTFGDRHRAAITRLVHVAPGRCDDVSDLAREVHYRYVDEPLLERAAAAADEHVNDWLHELATDNRRNPQGYATIIEALAWCPRPLRRRLRDAYLLANEAGRRRLLEARVRRFYRLRSLTDVHALRAGRFDVCVGDYPHGDETVHLVSAYCALAELPDVLVAARDHMHLVPADRAVVVDVETWQDAPRPDIDQLAAQVRGLVDGLDVGRDLRRLDVTVTSGGTDEEHQRTQHVTFRQHGGVFVEDRAYRNLHPMIAKRLDLDQWSAFDLQRLRSAEDVYLFTAVAKDHPGDRRLIALAEVRDLTPATDSTGRVTGYPLLERMLSEAFTSIRHATSAYVTRDRPVRNRVVLYVRPAWEVPSDAFRTIAHRWAPVSAGLGLEQVQLRVQIPDRGAVVIDVTGVADQGVTILAHEPSADPIEPLSDYEQRMLKAERAGAPYPYELLRMLTPPPDAPSDFPPGEFVEHDLGDGETRLVPVDRAPGRNTCGIVTGVLTSYTSTVPEGMPRVVLLGDPTRGLGNLAEAECRRIIAAIDLAEERSLPLEWYALSSGARIAMDSGTENMDWIAAVLRRLIEFTQRDGEVNIVVTGINVGAQPYWNGEATMLMHTRGVLIMTPASAMVLTGKASLDYSGGVSAEDNSGIGGFERVMGPNGQGQYWAPNLPTACSLLLHHYDLTYVVPGEPGPRRMQTTDPADRDVCESPHAHISECEFTLVGDVFSAVKNADRKKPFDMRSVMRAVADADTAPLERWGRWRDGETAIVWDARIGGIPVCLLGIESHPLPRTRFVPADGPPTWTSGTLFPQSSRKLARAVNAASGNRPLVVLANLSGFDGSPESMRNWQLEYGAEIGRAVTNFRGPIVFVVVSRYHGGAFVVFSKKLNENMEIAAVEGSFASVIGGAPAAAVVFARDVTKRTDADPRVVEARTRLTEATADEQPALRRELTELLSAVRAQKLKNVADEFDAIHDIRRAQAVGSVDLIVPAREIRPYVIGALDRGLTRSTTAGEPAMTPVPG